ncbi:radical SAM protein [Staphylothermus marinus]|uniref:radical SAM protein n=1 Tax=Staphylothermus marinus TaxID=2280 RepID=UPI0003234E29|nr:radical SAM protein [Staphylothermus marinus]
MKLKTIYGPHPSRCFDWSLGVDVLLPPKRCPHNCIYCPLGRTSIKTMKPTMLIDPETVKKEIEEFIQVNGCIFRNILLWGYGDPLLNYHTPLVAKTIRDIINQYGCKSSIRIRTTGYTLGEKWASPILDIVDEVIIPFDAAEDTRQVINDPMNNAKTSLLIKILKSIPKTYRRKIAFEINLLKINGIKNSDPPTLDELTSHIGSTGIVKIYLKTINRPSWKQMIKPVRGKLFARVKDYLVDKGYIVKECISEKHNTIVLSSDLEEALINHLLRKPLSTDEIRATYGDKGVVLAEKMVLENLLDKILWGQKLFFKVKQTIDLYKWIGR